MNLTLSMMYKTAKFSVREKKWGPGKTKIKYKENFEGQCNFHKQLRPNSNPSFLCDDALDQTLLCLRDFRVDIPATEFTSGEQSTVGKGVGKC